MFKPSQRIILIGLVVASIVVTAILFGVPEYNTSVASTQLAATTIDDSQLAYYHDISYLPTATEPKSVYTVLFFCATWDSYSLRMSDMLRQQLRVMPGLQVVELEISDFRAEALKWDVTQPPAAILLDQKGVELGRMTSASGSDLQKLLSQIPQT